MPASSSTELDGITFGDSPFTTMNRKQRRIAASRQRKSNERTVSISEALSLAIQLHQHEHFDEAESIYSQILKSVPDHTDALHFFGVLLHQRGQSEQAIIMIQKAIAINPNYADAHNNLGNVFKETGRFEEAVSAYQKCLLISPDNSNALINLGAALREVDELDDAMKVLTRAIDLSPKDFRIFHNLGNVYKKRQQYKEAIEAYRKSIELMHPDDSSALIGSVYKSLTRTLFIDQKHDEAMAVIQQWLSYEPDNPIAKHMLSACSGSDIPERASDAFIEETFDVFASSFDEVLKRLGYRAPDLVGAAINEITPKFSRKLNILDAGCGTGLCGPILSEYAYNLTGVDLSRKMVDKAIGRKIYDQLFVAELMSFMNENPQTYDLIASADTLCYFGNLQDVLESASSALTDSGILVFTLEYLISPNTNEDYRLNPHGRFSHSRDYLIRILHKSNMQLLSLTVDKLRNEAGKPVEGMVITAKKCRPRSESCYS